MPGPEQPGAHVVDRLSGEDAPRWLTIIFVALGTLLAVAAAWLALTDRPTSPRQAPSEAVRATPALPVTLPDAATATAPASLPARESQPDATLSAGGDASAAPPPGAPAGAPTASSSDDVGQTLLSSDKPLLKREDCPPPIRIPFKLDSARPITKGVPMDINELRTFLSEHPQARLSIEGHADSTGAENYNLLLSYRRAKAVVSLLSCAGMSEKRMLIRAAGSSVNIEGLPGSSGMNRRVILQVIGVESCREAPSASLQ